MLRQPSSVWRSVLLCRVEVGLSGTTNTCRCQRYVVDPEGHALPGIIFPAQLEISERRFPIGFLINPCLVDIHGGSSVDDESGYFEFIHPCSDRTRGTIDVEFNASPSIGGKYRAHANARRTQTRKRGVVAFAIPHEDFVLAAHAEIFVFDAVAHGHEGGMAVALDLVGANVKPSVKRISERGNSG